MTGKNANQMHLRKQKESLYSQMQHVCSESIIYKCDSFIYPVTQQTFLQALQCPGLGDRAVRSTGGNEILGLYL